MNKYEVLEWLNNIGNMTKLIMDISNSTASTGWMCHEVYFEPDIIVVEMVKRGYKDRIEDSVFRSLSFESIVNYDKLEIH